MTSTFTRHDISTGESRRPAPGDMKPEVVIAAAFKTADVAGLRIFYREAGDPSKPIIVPRHGFPSSSSLFRDLIPRLADRFHVIAPDYPDMGYSDAPAPDVLRPTFDNVAMAIDAFIAQRAPGRVVLYKHDFGGPIGMRIATAHPERNTGLIFQNTTISLEGWNSARLDVYARLGGPETPEKLAEAEQLATVVVDSEFKMWRRCMGVEPTLEQEAARATVLKTARPTGTLPPPGMRMRLSL